MPAATPAKIDADLNRTGDSRVGIDLAPGLRWIGDGTVRREARIYDRRAVRSNGPLAPLIGGPPTGTVASGLRADRLADVKSRPARDSRLTRELSL
jgi:hypothetical protein